MYVAREYPGQLRWCVDFSDESVGMTIRTGLDEVEAKEAAGELAERVAARVGRGYDEGGSRVLLHELIDAHDGDSLAHALDYNGFGLRRTRRERMEARAERRREWAGGREAKAASAFDAGRAIGEHIPMGQPILVGHHSEGRARRDVARMQGLANKAVEHSSMAEHHASKAEGIERQLRGSIFSDDRDAIEQLDAKIAKLEAERDRWKAFNAACRKSKRVTGEALALLDDRQRASYVGLVRVCAYQIRDNGSAPAYISSNLSGNINRLKKRRDALASN